MLPFKNTKVPCKPCAWINKDYIDLRLQVTKAKERATKTKAQADWDIFRKMSNSLNILAHKLKRDHFSNKIDEAGNDSGKLWTTLKEILPNKKQHNGITGVNCNGEILTTHKDIANCFNLYFSTVG